MSERQEQDGSSEIVNLLAQLQRAVDAARADRASTRADQNPPSEESRDG